jgi:acetoin utilization deacetylase AcuC-like enzyme
MAKTALIYREEILKHDTGPFHPESAARAKAIMEAFEKADLNLPLLDIEKASRADLLRVHDEAHVDTIEKTCANSMPYPDPDTPMVPASWEAALLSAGGAISACKAVLAGEYDNACSIMRPPGHHAERDHAMGFCLFNNAAVAARWLREEAGLNRIAILDWDIHHGNGTQHTFYDDATVYYISLHQHPHYPGTGFPHERGKDKTNLNIQMPPGCAPGQWHHALEKQVLPQLELFDPDFLIISTGYDAHRLDPLGRQLLEAEDYARMTRAVRKAAGGKIISVLEGGYHLDALGQCAVAHARALMEDR